MNRQPDKLFRDKLKHFERPVSPDAWNRISRHVGDKRKGSLWLKVAAALLLLAAAGVLLFSAEFNRHDKAIAENEISSPAQSPAEKNPAPETLVPTLKDTEQRPPANPLKDKKINRDKKKKATPATQETQSQKQTENRKGPTPVLLNEVVAIEILSSPKDADSLSFTKQDQRVTLEYSAEEVNKYLDKNTLADATPEVKKSSTLRKMLDKAYDLKHNQDPLGDLRQKKNEIFAFNFKSEKQRSENK